MDRASAGRVEEVEKIPSSEAELDTYERKTKAFLERLILQVEKGKEDRAQLEEQIDILQEEMRIKENELLQLSTNSQEAVDCCRAQAEQMADVLMGRLTDENKQRVDAESVVNKLQMQLCISNSDITSLKLQLASNDYATANDLMKNKIQLLNEELVTHRKSSQQLEALQQQRDHEIRAVLAMSTVFEKRISVLQCSTAQVRRLYKESQESNKQLAEENARLRCLVESQTSTDLGDITVNVNGIDISSQDNSVKSPKSAEDQNGLSAVVIDAMV